MQQAIPQYANTIMLMQQLNMRKFKAFEIWITNTTNFAREYQPMYVTETTLKSHE